MKSFDAEQRLKQRIEERARKARKKRVERYEREQARLREMESKRGKQQR